MSTSFISLRLQWWAETVMGLSRTSEVDTEELTRGSARTREETPLRTWKGDTNLSKNWKAKIGKLRSLPKFPQISYLQSGRHVAPRTVRDLLLHLLISVRLVVPQAAPPSPHAPPTVRSGKKRKWVFYTGCCLLV